MLYPLAMAVLLAGYSYATRDVWSFVGAAAAAAVGCMDYSTRVYAFLSQHVPGINALAAGTLFFLIAAFISLLKAGLLRAWSATKWRLRT
jgi:hypothetical protein